MRAIRIYRPKKIKIEEVPTPKPREDEVLVRIMSAGICGSDIEFYRGTHPFLTSGIAKFPLIPGHEWSGIVEEMGEQVTSFKVGDRVTGDVSVGCGKCPRCVEGRYNICFYRTEVGIIGKQGAMAEYIVMPERHTYPVPDSVSYEEASLSEPCGIAVHGVERACIVTGEQVVIFGDGTIGQLALQSAKSFPESKVIMVGKDKRKLELASSMGAETIINFNSKRLLENIFRLTDGMGADLAIEASGDKAALQSAINCVRPGGRVSVISVYEEDKFILPVNRVITQDINLLGVVACPNTMRGAIRMIEKGKIKIMPLITHRIPMHNAQEAFEIANNHKVFHLKVLILIGNSEREKR